MRDTRAETERVDQRKRIMVFKALSTQILSVSTLDTQSVHSGTCVCMCLQCMSETLFIVNIEGCPLASSNLPLILAFGPPGC